MIFNELNNNMVIYIYICNNIIWQMSTNTHKHICNSQNIHFIINNTTPLKPWAVIFQIWGEVLGIFTHTKIFIIYT